MIDAGRALADDRQDILVARHVGAQEILLAQEDRPDALRLEDLPGAFEPGHGDFLIAWVEKPIGADDGVAGRVGGVDGDVASGEGRDERSADEGAVKEQVLDVRPVDAEGGVQILTRLSGDGGFVELFETCVMYVLVLLFAGLATKFNTRTE